MIDIIMFQEIEIQALGSFRVADSGLSAKDRAGHVMCNNDALMCGEFCCFAYLQDVLQFSVNTSLSHVFIPLLLPFCSCEGLRNLCFFRGQA